jgi:deoxyribodipyrimidine photo-lyase
MQKINIFWFRRDLRLEDNNGLFQACKEDLPVMLIFIFDPDILKAFADPKDRRLTFIFNSLNNIQTQLKKKQKTLCVFFGKPVDIFEKLSENYQIQKVFCNHDYEPYSIQRDQNIMHFLNNKGIAFKSFKDQVIFEKDDILNNSGQPYTVFTPYMKKWKKLYFQNKSQNFQSENFLHNVFATKCTLHRIEDIGYQHIHFRFPEHKINERIIRNYHQTRDFPAMNGTSKIGIHLRFGTISVRKTVEKAIELNESWLNELIWREFFMQILWHFPHVASSSFKTKYNFIPWRNDEKEFERWCNAETGFPMVDAGIRELIETGYMHNRVRMLVANFLTKLLLIDWQWGELFFAKHLSDYELSSNNGNWQWAAGTGADATPYFRIFNPDEQIKRFDPDNKYIKEYVQFQSPFYPKPMIDYKFCRKRCLDVFSKL